MLTLRSATPSPFGRKIKIALSILGMMDQTKIIMADTNDDKDSLRKENPLGKIPCLIDENGTAIYDSFVILDWLNERAGGNRLIPSHGPERTKVLTLNALADGVMDAGVLLIYEQRWREPAMRSEKWTAHHQAKIDRALAVLEAAPPSGPVDIGHIAVACALGYLDLRFAGSWRANHPKLVAWLDNFAKAVPSFESTRAPS